MSKWSSKRKLSQLENDINMRFRCLLFLLVSSLALSAQSFEEHFRSFQQQAHKDYYDFRDAANERYAQFLLDAWQYYKVGPAISAPQEDPVPNVTVRALGNTVSGLQSLSFGVKLVYGINLVQSSHHRHGLH